MNYKIVRICDSATLSVIPREPIRFDIERCGEILDARGYEIDNAGVMITVNMEGTDITLYPNGRLMLHPADDKEEAASIADRFYAVVLDGVEGTR